MANGNFGVSEFLKPEPIDQKFGTRDYVGKLTSYAKFNKIRRHKG